MDDFLEQQNAQQNPELTPDAGNPSDTPVQPPVSEAGANTQPVASVTSENPTPDNTQATTEAEKTSNTFSGNSVPSFPQDFQPTTFQPQSFEPPVKKEKSKIGKTIFIIFVILCIIIASLFIGMSLSDKDFGSESPQAQNEESTQGNVDGAEPNIQESPYNNEEYSGKGVMTPAQVYEAVKESNVAVLVYYQNQQVGEGSGVIVGEDKTKTYTYIITCAHVIAESGISVQVQFYDTSEYDAQIVGIDAKTDIAVIRVKKTGFKAAVFGDSESLKVGTPVYAIGNPGGTEFFGSFTNGMVSALDRPVATASNGYYDLPCIQHTAAINPGNSGGALVNEYGQVVGINSSKIADTDYEGMGFSVPSTKVLEIYNQLITYGYVADRPMLGIRYYAVATDSTYSALAWKNDLPYGSIVVASIATNSSLNESNVKVGDIITAVNGVELEDTSILLEVIEKAKVDDKITLTVVRLNNSGSIATTFDVEVTLVEDKGNTTYNEDEMQQQSEEDYYENFPFNPFGN